MADKITQNQHDQLLLYRGNAAIAPVPASMVEGGVPSYDTEPAWNNADLAILASAVRAASANGQDYTNRNARGLHLVIDMTVVPGGDTVTFTIEGKDPVSGKYYTILASAAIVAVSTVVLRVYPGLTAAANLTASDVLPRTWRVRRTHSAGTNFTYSVGAIYIN